MLCKTVLQFYIVICISVASVCCGPFTKDCDDCELLTSCPGAVYLAVNKKNRQSEEIIKNALCSTDQVNGIPKVCCSDFAPAPEETDNHPNLRLLPEDCGDIEGSRIVGGEIAKLYEFPWMVLISYYTRIGREFHCGGSLINPMYVLTAAHCVKDKKIAGVRIGDHDYKAKVDCEKGTNVCESNLQDITVVEKKIHSAYQGPPVVLNDIALLRLKKPADFTLKNVGAICLPVTQTLRERSLDAEQATVAGWGLTENRTESSVLLKVIFPIRSSEACRLLYNRNLAEESWSAKNILCAGELGKDSCKGDSGGPLMLEGGYNNEHKYIQYGIVSSGPIHCGSGVPGIYTDVSRYMNWILDNIKS